MNLFWNAKFCNALTHRHASNRITSYIDRFTIHKNKNVTKLPKQVYDTGSYFII